MEFEQLCKANNLKNIGKLYLFWKFSIILKHLIVSSITNFHCIFCLGRTLAAQTVQMNTCSIDIWVETDKPDTILLSFEFIGSDPSIFFGLCKSQLHLCSFCRGLSMGSLSNNGKVLHHHWWLSYTLEAVVTN